MSTKRNFSRKNVICVISFSVIVFIFVNGGILSLMML